MAEPVGEFSLKGTGVTLSVADDGFTLQWNYEGTVTGYGTVLGTLTSHAAEAGVESGSCNWVGGGFLDDGTSLAGVGEGSWKLSGHHKWEIEMNVEISDGTKIKSVGEVDLESRSYNGKLYAAE